MRMRRVKNAISILENSPYVINGGQKYKGAYQQLFKNNNPIYLEIGCGKGKFIVENAINNPNINYIGVEMNESVLVRTIEKLKDLDLKNIILIWLDANGIIDVFDKEIDLLYLNFSDPWPKKRHYKRRLTSYVFLPLYDQIFKGNPIIKMKTDNLDLFNYSLESLTDYGYEIVFKTNDLHKENMPNILTEYEEKFSNLGTKINYLEAIKK